MKTNFETVVLDYEPEISLSNGHTLTMQVGDFYEYELDPALLRGKQQVHSIMEIAGFYKERGEVKINTIVHDSNGNFENRLIDFEALQLIIHDQRFTRFEKTHFDPNGR